MIDIIFLAVIAGILIIRLLMVLGEKRDDDPTPPFSLLDATKKQPKNQKKSPAEKTIGNQVIRNDHQPTDASLPDAEVVEPEMVGFYLKPKTKHKDSKKTSDKLDAVIEDSKDPRWAEAWSGIMAIKARVDGFVANEFLTAAENAFEVILDSFVRGNEVVAKATADKEKDSEKTMLKKENKKLEKRPLDILKEYVADDLLVVFVDAIKQREKNSYRQETKNLIGIRQSSIIDALIDEKNKNCQVKVLFESDQIYALYDKHNKLIEGDDSQIIPKKDIWVFEKKLTMNDDGRWWLVAVES
ncbi:MAG: TIM44-like domain-containing protein [Alphaproteobacteria bacterium]